MKRTILVILCLALCPAVATAQMAGSIGAFATSDGSSAEIVDTGGLVVVHLLHVYTDGATASQFKLDIGTTGWMHLGDNIAFPTKIGTSITGLSVGYGSCLAGPIYIGSVNFFGTSAAECSLIGIVADPTAPTGMIEAVDCNIPQNKFFPDGGYALVNATPDCTTPIEQRTWGGIKALYR